MMSKKGLLKFVKYTLIFSNAFGFILSIFLGLFGIAYPDKHFPLSYKGREMALCSLFCMLFTTIGYCGAQNHRRILLIIYGATNVIIVIIVVILWFLFRENSILGNKEISNMFITTLAITIAVMFLFAFILAFHIQTFKDDAQDSIVSQSHQLLQQTTAFLQQQQQQHQLQQQQQHHHSGIGVGVGVGGHHNQQMPSSSGNNQTQQLMTLEPQVVNQNHHNYQHVHPSNANANAAHLHPQQLIHDANTMNMAPIMSHHHAPPTHRMAATSAMTQAIPMTHIKSASQRAAASKNKSNNNAGALMLPPPHVGAAPAGMLPLMRNQSSPLPGVGVSVGVAVGVGGQMVTPGPAYQTTGRASKQQQQQLYSQSQKHSSRGGGGPPAGLVAPPSPPSPPPPPPPPPPPTGTNTSAPEHQHHHSSVRNSNCNTNRLPPCPVQYCTFDCDRTV